MQFIIDDQSRELVLPATATLNDLLDALKPEWETQGRVMTGLILDGQALVGVAFGVALGFPVANHQITLTTGDRADLARTIIGKTAALVDYLGRRHHEIADLLNQGQTAKALTELGEVLGSWQQVQQSFTGLTKLLKLDLSRQLIGDKIALDVLLEFRKQLEEIGRAVQGQDMVLLGDVLQYELDTGIAHWNDLLATTLGIVDGVVELAV